MSGSIEHVSDTAFLVAQCRAVESARSDALFRDPFAARLTEEKGPAILEAFPTARMTTWMVAIRTVVIDEFIRGALDRGVDAVLNLGAGLDTRPYRMPLPQHLRWIEVDYPDVIAFKDARLSSETPRCRLDRVGIDLADVSARRAFLQRIDAEQRRILVITEGVVPYLEVQQAAALADDLRALPHLDGWIVDYVSKRAQEYRGRRARLKRTLARAPFKFTPDDWFTFFAAHGFRVHTMRYLPERGRELGRPAPWPWYIRALTSSLARFAPPERRQALLRAMGYALLEPA